MQDKNALDLLLCYCHILTNLPSKPIPIIFTEGCNFVAIVKMLSLYRYLLEVALVSTGLQI